MSCPQLGQAELLLLSPKGPAMTGGASRGWLQVSHQRAKPLFAQAGKVRASPVCSRLEQTSAATSETQKHQKNVAVTEKQPLLQTSTSEALCKPSVSAERLLHKKHTHSPSSQGRVTQGSCTPSLKLNPHPEICINPNQDIMCFTHFCSVFIS